MPDPEEKAGEEAALEEGTRPAGTAVVESDAPVDRRIEKAEETPIEAVEEEDDEDEIDRVRRQRREKKLKILQREREAAAPAAEPLNEEMEWEETSGGKGVAVEEEAAVLSSVTVPVASYESESTAPPVQFKKKKGKKNKDKGKGRLGQHMSSLVNKWNKVQKAVQEEAGGFTSGQLEESSSRRKIKEIEEWERDMMLSGAHEDSVNFTPLGTRRGER